MRSGLLLPAAGYVALAFLYAPVAVLAVFSFNGGRYTSRWESFSLEWYGRLFDPYGSNDRLAQGLPDALSLSLRVAVAAAILAVVLSAATAIGLRGAKRRLSTPLLALWTLPIVLPDVVLGVSWKGALDLVGLPSGLLSLLLVHGTMAAAFGLVVVRARMATLDPSLVEAARDLGASPARATWHVVLPHLRPALVAAALLGFTLSFDDFMVTFFVQPPAEPTLPMKMYGSVVRGASPVLNALATLSLVGTFVVAWIAMRAARAVR